MPQFIIHRRLTAVGPRSVALNATGGYTADQRSQQQHKPHCHVAQTCENDLCSPPLSYVQAAIEFQGDRMQLIISMT